MLSNSLQAADHDALVASGNPTYSKLLAMVSQLQTKYETLQFVFFYLKYTIVTDTAFRDAYLTLANTIPKVFHFIPNPLDIRIPTDPNSPSLPNSLNTGTRFSQADCPLVTYWLPEDVKKADSDLAKISEDSNSSIFFLEHRDGSAFSETEVTDVRGHMRAAFNSLLEKGLAPMNWSGASSVALNWVRSEMLAFCPDLGLCAGSWKIDTLIKAVYPAWKRYRKSQIESSQAAAVPSASQKRKSDASSSSVPSKKSKLDSSSTTKSKSKRCTP
jgi:hypothetical protein